MKVNIPQWLSGEKLKIKNRSVVSENRSTKKERKKKKHKREKTKQIQTEFSMG